MVHRFKVQECCTRDHGPERVGRPVTTVSELLSKSTIYDKMCLVVGKGSLAEVPLSIAPLFVKGFWEFLYMVDEAGALGLADQEILG